MSNYDVYTPTLINPSKWEENFRPANNEIENK